MHLMPHNPLAFGMPLIAVSAVHLLTALVCNAAGPNLLVIQTDEHNFRTLGCYRQHLATDQAFMWGDGVKVETPNIDSIAERGVLCTSFYAASPVCTPSRASLMTGRYPQNTGAHTNDLPLRDDMVTFAEILRRQGYATGYSGKWHLDGTAKPGWQPDRQFGFADNRYMFNRGHWKHLELDGKGPRVGAIDKKGKPSYKHQAADERTFTTDWLADRTVEFIEANAASPFCYMVSFPDPHGPNTVRPPYDSMFDPGRFETPRTYDQSRDTMPKYLNRPSSFKAQGMAQYFGMVKCLDDNVGKIMECLRRNSILDQTMIVFTSDHGDLCGEHHRDNKGNPYEASARVPFLVTAPGRLPEGLVLNEAMSTVDFAPTILSVMEASNSERSLPAFEGRDLSKLFRTGKTDPSFKDLVILRRAGSSPGWIAAVTDRYKLVLSPQDVPWLFDMQRDPDEITNFYSSDTHADVVRELASALSEYGPQHQDPHLRHPKMIADLESALKR